MFILFQMKYCCRIYPHPLKYNVFVLIVENSPLHYIGTEQECLKMRKRWEKIIEEYGKKRTATNVHPGKGCEDM